MREAWVRWCIVGTAVAASILPAMLTNQIVLLVIAPTLASYVAGRRMGVGAAIAAVLLYSVPLLPHGLGPLVLPSGLFLATAMIVVAAIRPRSAPLADEAMRFAAAVAENMPSMGWSMNATGEYTYRNDAVWQYVAGGTHTREKDWKDVQPIIHPDDIERTISLFTQSLEAGVDFQIDHRVRRHDGVYRWFRAYARPSRNPQGGITGWYGTSLDIDDYKVAERALKDRESELRELIDAIPALIWAATPAGEPSFANRRTNEFSGIAIPELDDLQRSRLDKAIEITIHPGDRARVGPAMMKAFESGTPFSEIYRLRRHDGVYRWFDSRLEPFRSSDGNIVRWYGVLVDVDDSKRSEDALRASERQLKLLVETMPAMVWCASPAGQPTYVNKRLADYTGVRPESLERSDQPVLEIAIDAMIHPADQDPIRNMLVASFASGQPFSLRYRTRRHDGIYRWVDSRSEPLRDEDGRLLQWYTVVTDIDDETRMQEELRSAHERLAGASKAASLAELSASIADEVNQPLAGIVLASQACERWLAASPPNIERAVASVERIARDAKVASGILGRIHALFRRNNEARTEVDIDALVLDVVSLVARDAQKHRIHVETEFAGLLPKIAVNRNQLEQVLANLIENGLEAVELLPHSEKKLTIRSGHRKDGTIYVEIRDFGPGIEDLSKIFDPFYSTKPDRLGLGLTISRSIVEAHGGRLLAENISGGGAVLTFTLPCAKEA